jgi:hypothetical protein
MTRGANGVGHLTGLADQAGSGSYNGFGLLPSTSAAGIGWEFTGQTAAACNYLGGLLNSTTFQACGQTLCGFNAQCSDWVVTANAAIVPAGNNGNIAVFVSNSSNLIIDINGYFAPPAAGGLSLFTLDPCRVLDTRNPPGSPPLNGAMAVNVANSGCGASVSAQAFVLNATVVPQGVLGFLTLWPQGSSQPLVSTLNASDGAITSNLAIVPTSNGSISAFASNPTHLVLDISGFFAP